MKKCNVCHAVKSQNSFIRREQEFKNCNDCYEKKKEYKQKNKEKIQKMQQEYYEKNKTKIQHDRLLNREEINKKAKEYYALNKDHIRKKRSGYEQKNKVLKFIKQNKLSIEYKASLEKLLHIKNCPICNVKFKYGKEDFWNSSSFDHIIPGISNIENFQIICMKCNRIKNNLSLQELEKLSQDKLQIIKNNNPNILSELNITKRRFDIIYKAKKGNAKKRNIEFSLTKNDLLNILTKKCPIFGFELNYNGGRHNDNTFSIDRIDNTKGYSIDNCRVISYKANSAKWKATKKEINKLYEFMFNLFEK